METLSAKGQEESATGLAALPEDLRRPAHEEEPGTFLGGYVWRETSRSALLRYDLWLAIIHGRLRITVVHERQDGPDTLRSRACTYPDAGYVRRHLTRPVEFPPPPAEATRRIIERYQAGDPDGPVREAGAVLARMLGLRR